MHHFVAIGEFKLELQSGNAQFGWNLAIFRAVWPWNHNCHTSEIPSLWLLDVWMTISELFSNFHAQNQGSVSIDKSHVTTAIWWLLGVAVVSVTCMRVCWVSHTWKNMQWNIFLFESSHKSPYWTNPYHRGFRYEASLNFHTYFRQSPNDTYILLHIPLHVCPNNLHTGLTRNCRSVIY